MKLLLRGGFLIVEVLIAIMVLAVAFVALLGAMAQAVKVSSKSSQMTDAISCYESFLFEIESGVRPDIAGYGGHGDLERKYHYQIESETNKEFSSLLKSRFSWKDGKESLDLQFLAQQAPAE